VRGFRVNYTKGSWQGRPSLKIRYSQFYRKVRAGIKAGNLHLLFPELTVTELRALTVAGVEQEDEIQQTWEDWQYQVSLTQGSS